MVHKVTNSQQIALQSQFIMYQSVLQILGTVAFLLPVKLSRREIYTSAELFTEALFIVAVATSPVLVLLANKSKRT